MDIQEKIREEIRKERNNGYMKAYLTVSEAAHYLSVCCKTIRRWGKAGKITCVRTPGNHRRITITEIKRVMGENEHAIDIDIGKTAVYCRVSSHEQKKKGDLQRQVTRGEEYCRTRGYTGLTVLTDTGSGLNVKRRWLKRMCRFIERGEIDHEVFTYSDRLMRFGFEYLQKYFTSHGTAIEVIEEQKERTEQHGEKRSLEKELVADIIAIVTSFSGKVHSLRSSRAGAKKAREKQE